MLSLEGVCAGYSGLEVVQGASFEVRQGELFSMIGANGAGKTTTLRCISGLIRPTGGRIRFNGEDVTNLSPKQIVQRGLIHVPEGRELFPELTVLENLRLGGLTRTSAEREQKLEEVLTLFPRLGERAQQSAGTLSGGEQQMVAIGRALMSYPRLLMLDEPSIGLAPKIVSMIFDLIRQIIDLGITVLLVEQNAVQALSLADRACVMESGHVVLAGPGQELLHDPAVRTAYLGL
jgi:branched-chain amino acid transport system ATP-binding protein